MTPARNRRRASWLAAALTITGLAAFALYKIFSSDGRAFSAFELHGGPVVITSPTNPTILALTSHREVRRLSTDDYSARVIATLHYDLWSINANDLTRRWVTRLASINRGALNIQATLLGVDDGAAWVLADQLLSVSVSDGHVIGDAAAIESRNAVLHGVMPSSRQQLVFDNGLIVIAADGKRWRINSQTLLASDASSTVERGDGSYAVKPLSMHTQSESFKERGYVVGDHWYGMMHPSELPQFEKRDPYTQDFRESLRYRLWSAPIHDTLNRFRDPVKEAHNWAPVLESPEFLMGSLLAIPDTSGKQRVVGIANPTRFLVLHQDRIDQNGTQIISCIGLDGKVCWNASLAMPSVHGFGALMRGTMNDWALLAFGDESNDSASTLEPDRDGVPVIARVAIADGSVRRFSFAHVEFGRLADELKPYHKVR